VSDILYNSAVITPIDKPALIGEVNSMISHETALEEILQILETIPRRATKTVATIERELVTTYRGLHYLCMDRQISPTNQLAINERLPKLRFRQTFLKPFDSANLMLLLESITSKQRMDVAVPFDGGSGNIFTTSLTLSSLCAFGPIAPSPIDPSNSNSSVTVRDGFVRGTSQGTLGGIPIFAMPIQQASENWKTLKKTGTLVFRVRGRTNFGMMKIANLGTLVPLDDDVSKSCGKLLVQFCRKADKKRGRGEDDEHDEWTGISKMDSASQSAHTAKKQKTATEADEAFGAAGW
jgi:hypothetical protein